ncbi:hypothetical protein YDYSY3_60920 [Paenibacillus chitinolyticus]|nr:hypothetical protein YDYSY3_60920 [Paenibacillus chitinolyticus]
MALPTEYIKPKSSKLGGFFNYPSVLMERIPEMNATQGVQAVQSFYFWRKRRAVIRGEKHRKKAKPIPEPIKSQPTSRCIGYVAALYTWFAVWEDP